MVIIGPLEVSNFLGTYKVTNQESQRLKLVPQSQVEAMAQLLVAQGKKLRELEIRLQKEAQEKANLALDFQNLLDQLSMITGNSAMAEDHAVVCG